MIIIKIEGKDNLDRSLKKLKRKFESIGITKELRKRKEFKKKSDKRREEVKKARYIEKLKSSEY